MRISDWSSDVCSSDLALGSVDLMHRLQKWFPRGRAWGLLTPVALVLCWTALSLSLADAKPMRAQWTTFDGALNAMKTVGRTKRYCCVGLSHGQIWVAGYSYRHCPIQSGESSEGKESGSKWKH